MATAYRVKKQKTHKIGKKYDDVFSVIYDETRDDCVSTTATLKIVSHYYKQTTPGIKIGERVNASIVLQKAQDLNLSINGFSALLGISRKATQIAFTKSLDFHLWEKLFFISRSDKTGFFSQPRTIMEYRNFAECYFSASVIDFKKLPSVRITQNNRPNTEGFYI